MRTALLERAWQLAEEGAPACMDRLGGPASVETLFARKHCLRWICLSGVVALAVIIVASLMLPAKSEQLPTDHWAVEHFFAYFGHIDIVCLGWGQPFVVVGTFMVIAALPEAPQGLSQSCTQSPFRTQRSRRSVGRDVTCHVPNPGMESA
jgi:hypothetical protein